ncbi:MAG: nucleotidyl transferase AbiEii/AbiGii toxin family protein [Nitrospirae bacterium]|nr:nucleotidyl transferase AbiEii/AbiGii toxin family protein [Nitrospirota bacterium]
MYLKTIDESVLELSKRLAFIKDFSFYLSGGTGLALQVGHRKSFDMDFFTRKEFLPNELITGITTHSLCIEGSIIRHVTLYCILEGVKTSFIFYPEPLLFPLKTFNSIDVADWRDIIVEKLRTIADRGQKKDFYDFYFAVQALGVDAVTELAFKKFGKRVNYFHLLKGLTYFEDADRNPEPFLTEKHILWEEIKEFFSGKIKDFETAFSKVCR